MWLGWSEWGWGGRTIGDGDRKETAVRAGLLRKISTIDKPLARLIRKKKRRHE